MANTTPNLVSVGFAGDCVQCWQCLWCQRLMLIGGMALKGGDSANARLEHLRQRMKERGLHHGRGNTVFDQRS